MPGLGCSTRDPQSSLRHAGALGEARELLAVARGVTFSAPDSDPGPCIGSTASYPLEPPGVPASVFLMGAVPGGVYRCPSWLSCISPRLMLTHSRAPADQQDALFAKRNPLLNLAVCSSSLICRHSFCILLTYPGLGTCITNICPSFVSSFSLWCLLMNRL